MNRFISKVYIFPLLRTAKSFVFLCVCLKMLLHFFKKGIQTYFELNIDLELLKALMLLLSFLTSFRYFARFLLFVFKLCLTLREHGLNLLLNLFALFVDGTFCHILVLILSLILTLFFFFFFKIRVLPNRTWFLALMFAIELAWIRQFLTSSFHWNRITHFTSYNSNHYFFSKFIPSFFVYKTEYVLNLIFFPWCSDRDFYFNGYIFF